LHKLKDDDTTECTDGHLYISIVGSLIYAMSATRPDLCFIVSA